MLNRVKEKMEGLFANDFSGHVNTDVARKIAEKRTIVMEEYLDEFMKEWNGEI